MAKIEFSASEIATLKKAAAEAQKAAVERAKAIIKESGIEFNVSPELKALAAPAAETVGGDGCYACISCLFLSLVVFVSWTT
jgi:hypothetical protein